MKKIYFFCLFLVPALLIAQGNLLDKKVSLRAKDKTLEQILQILSEEGQFFFSYNPAILPLDQRRSIFVQNQPIRKVLDLVIKDTLVVYKAIGNHIILNKKEAAPRPKPSINKTRGPVAQKKATPKEKKVDPPVVSIPEEEPEIVEEIVEEESPKQPLPELREMDRTDFFLEEIDQSDPVQNLGIVKLLIPEESRTPLNNKAQYQTQFGQLTLIPPISTQGLSGNGKFNHISINLLAGYSAGLKGVEIGGILNVDRHGVAGVQIAGVGNAVGGNLGGVQIAGGFNVNRKSVYGVQIAGLNNWADSLIGLQASPLNNVATGRLHGVQITGLGNIAVGKVNGLQIAGLANVSTGTVNGLQFAGLINYGKKLDGVQIAGLANISTGDLKGVQIAPIMNVAAKGKGVQIGFINKSDSLDGIPIGFINLVKEGYNGVEYTYGLTMPGLKLKAGNHRMYNMFAIGRRTRNGSNIWAYGYGIGMALGTQTKLRTHLETMIWQVNQGQAFVTAPNLLSQVYLGFNIPLFWRLELSFGPTANFHYSKYRDNETGAFLSDLAPYSIASVENGESRFQFWLGGQVSLMLHRKND